LVQFGGGVRFPMIFVRVLLREQSYLLQQKGDVKLQKIFMSLVLVSAIAGVAVGPSIAGQPPAVQENMHHQQVGRAKKALENALVALQASGDWGSGNGNHGNRQRVGKNRPQKVVGSPKERLGIVIFEFEAETLLLETVRV
jgi:hypothetical protein